MLAADYWLYDLWGRPGPPPRPAASRPFSNGIWLRYTWYFGEKSEPELIEMAARLLQHKIRDAYFHVRYIKADGTLRFRFRTKAVLLNARLERLNPNLRRIAWIFAGHGKLGDVDLSKPEVRERMAGEAAWLVNECGFQGVQWDYEVCPDGDPHFLDLLDRTRRRLPKSATLGVAAPMWFPIKGIGWSAAYYAEVAKRCGQVAVMCYDSGAYFPRAYTWLVERQVDVLPSIVSQSNPKCELILGLPTYEEGPPSHNPRAENLQFALWGVRKGLAATPTASITGIALFADYTTEEEEWRVLKRYWTSSGGAP